jgi:hypothetical protein
LSGFTEHKSASAACGNLHKVVDAFLALCAGLLTCRTSARLNYRDCTVYIIISSKLPRKFNDMFQPVPFREHQQPRDGNSSSGGWSKKFCKLQFQPVETMEETNFMAPDFAARLIWLLGWWNKMLHRRDMQKRRDKWKTCKSIQFK